jgi:uncharacterized membrane protein (UPF0127 family)
VASRPAPPAPFGETAIVTPAGTKCVLTASTDEARQRGLMGVRTTAPWDGMIFVDFSPAPTTIGFWMKNTLIPLDIAYIGVDGAVVDVLTMEPCPPTAQTCPSYPPARPYGSALEVEKGKASAFGLAVGAHVTVAGPCSGSA